VHSSQQLVTAKSAAVAGRPMPQQDSIPCIYSFPFIPSGSKVVLPVFSDFFSEFYEEKFFKNS
jgi:hypothetical protein